MHSLLLLHLQGINQFIHKLNINHKTSTRTLYPNMYYTVTITVRARCGAGAGSGDKCKILFA